jgi:hypothetical protein
MATERNLRFIGTGGWLTVAAGDAEIVMLSISDRIPINWLRWPEGMVADLVSAPVYHPDLSLPAPAVASVVNAILGIVGGAATLGTLTSLATISAIASWFSEVTTDEAKRDSEPVGCMRRAQHEHAVLRARRWPALGVRGLTDGRILSPGRALCCRQLLTIFDDPNGSFTAYEGHTGQPAIPTTQAVLLLEEPSLLPQVCRPGGMWALLSATPQFVCDAIDVVLR